MVYTFKCEKCGEIEVTMSYKELPLKECPHCKGKVERVFKPVMDVWKCGGAYGKSST